MSRTLLIAENFPPFTGGAARRFGEIYRRQPQTSVTVLTGHAEEADGASTAEMDVVRLSPAASAREFSGAVRVSPFGEALRVAREIVRDRAIERIHCGRPLPEGWLALALRLLDGISYDCFVHGEEINLAGSGEPCGFLASRRYRLMTRAVLSGADRLVANGRHTADLLRDQWSIGARRTRILYPGVDTFYFSPAEADDQPPLPTWRGRRIVLAAGRLQRRKGYDILIRAIDSVRVTVPEVLLVIAGGGEEEAMLRAMIVRLGLDRHVSMLGRVDDDLLRSCFRHCELFVLANRQIGYDLEGFGMVLLEAQACGKPVIAGNSGGSREAMRDGDTGIIVDCGTPEPLADAIGSLLADDDRRWAMGRAARRLMIESFDWKVVLRDAGELFTGARTRWL